MFLAWVLLAGAGELLAATPAAGFHTPFTGVPLSVTDAWNGSREARHVFVPQS